MIKSFFYVTLNFQNQNKFQESFDKTILRLRNNLIHYDVILLARKQDQIVYVVILKISLIMF